MLKIDYKYNNLDWKYNLIIEIVGSKFNTGINLT